MGDTSGLGAPAGHAAVDRDGNCWCGLREGHGDAARPEPVSLTTGDRQAKYAGLKVNPPSPQPHGMTVSDLAEAQRLFTNYARIRLLSASEYDDGEEQAFERFGPDRLLLELRQEIADAVNYLTFLDIQLARWGKRIEGMA